jgi:hypothetical protein
MHVKNRDFFNIDYLLTVLTSFKISNLVIYANYMLNEEI